MSESTDPQSGRTAAIARRRALTAGKAALLAEKGDVGQQASSLPVEAPPAAATAVAPANAVASPAGGGLSGRLLSIRHRRQLAAGKSSGQSGASATATVPAYAPPAPEAQAKAMTPSFEPSPIVSNCGASSCRDQARARRAKLSQSGRGDAPPAPPSRPERLGTLAYAPKVVESPTHGGQRVTGSRIGSGLQVTGDERGATMPVSGSQYLAADAAPLRDGGPKVGHARTAGGLIVSGTLVRSKVRVTGDERGDAIAITGKTDQRIDDDLTTRAGSGPSSTAQFQRQADPHGTSVFGANLGRSARSVGSRDRRVQPAIETTESGLAITGSAVGRSCRVTGDERGACRALTGTQYLAPALSQTECGGVGGGSAAAAQIGASRSDPASGSKVTAAETFALQRVTGIDIEHNPRVTGDAPGTCQIITGSQYQGAGTMRGWCDPATGDEAMDRLTRHPARAPVTGDTPVHDAAVTGTARGAGRDITGTPYYRDPVEASPAASVASIDGRFSIRTPQRSAQLASRRDATESGAHQRITGSFAFGQGKITGNSEFLFRPRQFSNAAGAEKPVPAHGRVTGEGRSEGTRITGDAWADQRNVTGSEGAFAAARNPSERFGEPRAFAGTQLFKGRGNQEEPRQLVTGMFYFSKAGAKVTLSGGAQG